MKIHSDVLTRESVRRFAHAATGLYPDMVERGSRKRAGAFDVKLRGGTNRLRNDDSGEYAATWDQWGDFLARVFELDPNADTDVYHVAEHFHWVTGDRYAAPFDHCDQHRWEWKGLAATGSYSVSECRKCGAILRRISGGHDWSEIAS